MPYTPLARRSVSEPYSGERCLNVFARGADVTSPVVLLGRSGLTETTNLGGPVRAMAEAGSLLYAVAGGKLWKWDGTTATSLGSIPDDANATVATTTSQVGVVAGGTFYYWDGSTLSSAVPGAVSTPRGVVSMGNYFIVWGDALGRSDGFQVSALNDGGSWDALDILYAEERADRIVSCIVYADRLFTLGSRTIEVWFDQGASVGVFRRDGTPVLDVGAKALKLACADVAGVFWVSPSNRVYRTQGAEPQVISTPEVEADLTDPERLFVVDDRGQKFLVVRQTSGPAWCYDLTTGLWSERSTAEGAWIATAAGYLGSTQYIGTTSGLSTASAEVFTDHGTYIPAEVVTPPVDGGGSRLSVREIKLRMVTGRRDIGRTPQILLSSSRDGFIWSTGRPRDIGDLGDYDRWVAWHGLGMGRHKQFRFRLTDPVDRDFYGLTYG